MSGNAKPILDKRGNISASIFLYASFIDSDFQNIFYKKKIYIFRSASFSGVAALKGALRVRTILPLSVP